MIVVSEEQLKGGPVFLYEVGFVKGPIFVSVRSVMPNYGRGHIEMSYALSDVIVRGVVVEREFVFDEIELNLVLGVALCVLLRLYFCRILRHVRFCHIGSMLAFQVFCVCVAVSGSLLCVAFVQVVVVWT